MGVFEKASRIKLRFPTVKGGVSIEDLWDMPLTHATGFSLDDLAKYLNKQIKESAEESFVTVRNKADEDLELSFAIVKHVIDYRLTEVKRKKEAAATKAKKEMIMEIIGDKQTDAIKRKSIPNLKKMLDEL